MLLNNTSKLSLKKFDEYLNKIDSSKIHYVTGSQNKKHIDDTFSLYFENISENNLFDSSKIDELKAWFIDISNYHKSTEDNNYPKVNKFKTEAIHFNGQIILKECFNLLNLIIKYHSAYIIKTGKKNSYVFLNADNEHIYDIKRVRDTHWKKVLKLSGLDYRPIYHTRHTFATIMIENNEDILWVSNNVRSC